MRNSHYYAELLHTLYISHILFFFSLYMVLNFMNKKEVGNSYLIITRTDPSAGSPTDTLLRLLLPLDNVI